MNVRFPVVLYAPQEGTDILLLMHPRHGFTLLRSAPDILASLETFTKDYRCTVDADAAAVLLREGFLCPEHQPLPDRSQHVGLVSTVYRPGQALVRFIQHHRQIGITRFFLFLDDPDDPIGGWLEEQTDVQLFRTSSALTARWRQVPAAEEWMSSVQQTVLSRQILNANVALQDAHGLDWLLHLDVDERLLAPGGIQRFLHAVPSFIGALMFHNLELAATVTEDPMPFSGARLFKRSRITVVHSPTLRHTLQQLQHRRPYFYNAYQNGKGAVRVQPGARIASVHEMIPAPSCPATARVLSTPAVLHAPSHSLSTFISKFLHIPRTYFHDLPDIPFQRKAWRAARSTKPEAFYAKHCVFSDQNEVAVLREAGMLLKLHPRKGLVEE